MGVSAKVVSFNTGTAAAGNTVDVTFGFQPKAIIFWWNGQTGTVDAVARADSSLGWGFAKDLTHRGCCTWIHDDGAGAEAGSAVISNTACIMYRTIAGGAVGSMDVDATANWPSDGVRLIVDVQFGASIRVHALGLGGSDITNTDVGTFQETADTAGTQDITTPGFEPTVVFLLTTNMVAFDTPDATNVAMALGFLKSSTQQAVLMSTFDVGSASADCGNHSSDGFACGGRQSLTAPANIDDEWAFSAMLSNGFRLAITEHAAATDMQVVYLAIKGGSWFQGNLTTTTDSNPIVESGFGFQPRAALFVSSFSRGENVTNAGSTGLRVSIGAASGASERACAAEYAEQGSGNMRVSNAMEHDAVYLQTNTLPTDGTAASILGLMDLTSFDLDGLTCVMDDPDPVTVSFVWYVAVGDGLSAALFQAQPDQVERTPQSVAYGPVPWPNVQ